MSLFSTRRFPKSQPKKVACGAVHNYFFIKGVDTLREGGIQAFITSRGVLDSPSNEPVREWLMKNTNLVSAIRLPNNLFTDHAGTEVGSDLIILQKNTAKTSLTAEETNFIKSRTLSSGENINNSFRNFDRIVYTKASAGTNQYGKPASIFIHEGGVSGMAADLKKMLTEDFSKHLSKDLYLSNSVAEQQKAQSQQPVQEETVSLYDLFGFSEAERSQLNVKKKSNRAKAAAIPPVPTLSIPVPPPPKPDTPPLEPRPYAEELKSFHKVGSLVIDNGEIGFLKERFSDGATFMPIELNSKQREKAELYIQVRDEYQNLYNYEASNLKENAEFRASLNNSYDSFVERHGNLNDKSNVSLIKMDAGGQEILSLERSIDGKLVKADIFNHPVAFNPHEITHVDTAEDALGASLNKFGKVDLGYMVSLMDDKSQEDLVQELQGRIYFNPLVNEYESTDRFISGNVVEKAHEIQEYLESNPDGDNHAVEESLKALQDAVPRPITFDELDFNFGERWIPANIYARYASSLFEVNTNIHYSSTSDEYSVSANYKNIKITDQYAVRGENRTFDGLALRSEDPPPEAR
jgi:hypothetical protein